MNDHFSGKEPCNSEFKNYNILNQMKERIYKSIIKYFKSDNSQSQNQSKSIIQTKSNNSKNFSGNFELDKTEKSPYFDLKMNSHSLINLKLNLNNNKLCMKSNSFVYDSAKQFVKHSDELHYSQIKHIPKDSIRIFSH